MYSTRLNAVILPLYMTIMIETVEIGQRLRKYVETGTTIKTKEDPGSLENDRTVMCAHKPPLPAQR